MGREQKRKELKKNKKSINNNIEENTIKISTTIKILLAVVIILLIVYYGLAVFVTKEINISGSNNNNTSSSNENGANNETNVSNKILASSTFNQPDSVYYVYFYNFSDEDESIASAIYNLTNNKVYRVDTSSGLNKKYVTEDSGNKNVSNINNLKVKDPTIIKIDNDKVTGYHEGVNDIINFINNE